MLKICNSLLKRVSKFTHHELRGQVQKLLASILKLGDKSGLNKKSLVNDTNIEDYLEEEETATNIDNAHDKLYKTFWKNARYLSNPFLLLEKKKSLEDDSEKSNSKYNL